MGNDRQCNINRVVVKMDKKFYAVVTVSDTCYAKKSIDDSGPHLIKLIKEKLGSANIKYDVVPDNEDNIEETLLYLTDDLKVDVIFTTGGTGFTKRDVTPEATKKVITKEALQLSFLMTIDSLKKTKYAALSRAVCGIRNDTLIINFPGSKRAVDECFNSISTVIYHAIELIKGDKEKIISTHKFVQHDSLSMKREICSFHKDTQKMGNLKEDRNSPYPMKNVNDALLMVFDTCQAYRIPKEVIKSNINIPPFRASIKDGYAIKSTGLGGVKKVLRYISAGDDIWVEDFEENECFKINTGAPVPSHADTIIQIEDTRLLSSTPNGIENEIDILVTPIKGIDIRSIGSDIKIGEPLFHRQQSYGPPEIALAASVGLQLQTERILKIGIISTGDELISPGKPLKNGQIYDSNTSMLKNLLQSHQINPCISMIVKDNYNELKSSIEKCLECCNFIICTGGVSMGDKDFVKPVLKDLGFEIVFGRVNMKPGKPLTFGHRKNEKFFFGLPGNPVSAFATFILFVIPTIRYISNWEYEKCSLPLLSFELLNDKILLDSRPEYVGAKVTAENDKLYAEIFGNQISSRIKSLVDADILLHLPSGNDQKFINKGEILKGTVLRHDFISKYA